VAIANNMVRDQQFLTWSCKSTPSSIKDPLDSADLRPWKVGAQRLLTELYARYPGNFGCDRCWIPNLHWELLV